MSRVNESDSKVYYPFIQQGWRLQSMQWTPADAYVLDPDAPPLLIMTPAGAIAVRMPTSSPDIKGLMFLICNASANAITLQTDGGAGFTTAIVLAANETTLVVCTGDATQAVGWRAIGTASSA